MDSQETQPKPEMKALVFDAEAPEVKVPFNLERKSKLYPVAHVFRSPSDADLLEYGHRRNVRMREATKAELGEKGVAMETDADAAAAWLWDKLIIRLEGYKDDQEWRTKVSLEDKTYAINDGLLACAAISTDPENADAGELADFDDDETDTNRIHLDFLIDGVQVKFFHDLRAASAVHINEYKSLMKTSYTVRGARLGKADIKVPSQLKKVASLYDQLFIGADPRYVNRIPLNHKVAVALEHFSKERETLGGN